MHYALLIYERPGATDGFDDDARRAITAEYMSVADEPPVLGWAHLQPTSLATSVRVSDGETLVTDGPFVETKEQIGGLMEIEAPDLDATIAIAARIPVVFKASVELRPVIEH
jgi:hypothetical protein